MAVLKLSTVVLKLSRGRAEHAGAEFWNLFTGMAVLKLSTAVLKLSRGMLKLSKGCAERAKLEF